MQQDKTLGDYIARKSDEPVKKKMSFDEWWFENLPGLPDNKEEFKFALHVAWFAGQENK